MKPRRLLWLPQTRRLIEADVKSVAPRSMGIGIVPRIVAGMEMQSIPLPDSGNYWRNLFLLPMERVCEE